MDVLQIVKDLGVIPVLGLKDPATAPRTAAALRKGGLPLLEITLRAETALDCLRAVKAADPEMPVGAGTVLSCQQVDQAREAGADFIVTPGFNAEVVRHCQELGLLVVPGCVTPTEIEAGLALGLGTFKFFPSEALGGVETIRQLCGPYRDVQFIPTSGITLSNMASYLAFNGVAAVGGSFMAPAALVEAQDWDGITALCGKAVEQSLGFSLAHIGINGADREEGLSMVRWFGERFGFPVKEGGKSNFAATYVECCNQKFPGKFGHIGIFTLSPDRAAAYFRAKGIPLRQEFRNVGPDGKLIAAYLEEEVGGFAVHIVRKPS